MTWVKLVEDLGAVRDLADLSLNDPGKENCANEFNQVRLAFRKTFVKHVDEDLMAKVRRMEDIQRQAEPLCEGPDWWRHDRACSSHWATHHAAQRHPSVHHAVVHPANAS